MNERIQQASAFVDLIDREMSKTIVGQKDMVQKLMVALLADGHILLEGVPGLAKTLAIKALAQSIDVAFSRIQFTPTCCRPTSSEQRSIARGTRSSP